MDVPGQWKREDRGNLCSPLSVGQDTPSLFPNATLWEMDDIEPTDQLQPQQTTIPSRSSVHTSLTNVATRGILMDKSVAKGLFGPYKMLPVSSGSFSSARSHRESHESLQYRRREGASAHMCSTTPLTLAHTQDPPSGLSFMKSHPQGDATITYLNDQGQSQSITGIAVSAIENSCPLLATAFEPRRSGPRLHLEILTNTTAVPFLRYLYTGSYAINADSVYENVPTSLLLHCQLYHLGYIYDLPVLMKQANVNIIRQCEFGCSSPNPPIHLTAAIEYAYKHLSSHDGVLDTIVSYCVACFLRHNLADHEEFKQVAFELRPFHQALCQESINRSFENESTYCLRKHNSFYSFRRIDCWPAV